MARAPTIKLDVSRPTQVEGIATPPLGPRDPPRPTNSAPDFCLLTPQTSSELGTLVTHYVPDRSNTEGVTPQSAVRVELDAAEKNLEGLVRSVTEGPSFVPTHASSEKAPSFPAPSSPSLYPGGFFATLAAFQIEPGLMRFG